MDHTVGQRIARLRREMGLKQEELAQMLGISGQAVSKWENNQTCPDITLLPQIAKIFNVTVDELLSGEKKQTSAELLPDEKRGCIKDMLLRITVDSAKGDKVRVNVPIALVQLGIECGMEMPQLSGNDVLKNIDWTQIMAMISRGVVGNLVEVESSDGDVVRITVE